MPQPGASLSERVRRILELARTAAGERGKADASSFDVAMAVLRDDGVGATAIASHGLDPSAIAGELASTDPGDAAGTSAASLIASASAEAIEMKLPYLGTEHLLLAILRDDTHPLSRRLASAGFTYRDARARIGTILGV